MALFSGIGERAPQGPLNDNNNTWNGKWVSNTGREKKRRRRCYMVEWIKFT